MATLAQRGPATESHGHAGRTLNLTLQVWRQKNATSAGKMVTYPAQRYQRGYVLSGDARCRQ